MRAHRFRSLRPAPPRAFAAASGAVLPAFSTDDTAAQRRRWAEGKLNNALAAYCTAFGPEALRQRLERAIANEMPTTSHEVGDGQ